MKANPTVFYKFRPFKEKIEIDRVKSIFFDHKLFAPTPDLLNDPFDCRADISLEATKEERLAAAKKWLRRHHPLMPRNELRKEAPAAVKRLLANGRKSIRDHIAKTGIVSFATTLNNQLLWSHYASSHEGLCIEFDLNRCSDNLGMIGTIGEVRYQEERVFPNFFRSERLEIVETMINTKPKEWDYEGEYRVILNPRPKSGCVPFDPKMISRVYAGCRMPPERQAELIRILADRKISPQIELFQMKASDTKFELVAVPVCIE